MENKKEPLMSAELYYDNNNTDKKTTAELMQDYANFLKQPLKLGMFVPCDENDVPYKSYKSFCHVFDKDNFICEPYEGLFEIQANEKSKGWAYLDPEKTRYYDKVSYIKAKEDFEKAKERVIFEGFYEHHSELYYPNQVCFLDKLDYKFSDWQTIEWLLNESYQPIKITDSAIKKYNL